MLVHTGLFSSSAEGKGWRRADCALRTDYHRIGYSLSKNNHLDKHYPELEKVTLSTEKSVKQLMREVQGLPDPNGPLPQLETRPLSRMTVEERRRQDKLAQWRTCLLNK
jgi:hypothetical protein